MLISFSFFCISPPCCAISPGKLRRAWVQPGFSELSSRPSCGDVLPVSMWKCFMPCPLSEWGQGSNGSLTSASSARPWSLWTRLFAVAVKKLSPCPRGHLPRNDFSQFPNWSISCRQQHAHVCFQAHFRIKVCFLMKLENGLWPCVGAMGR